jgi:protein O-mannosyl-transferase
MMQTFTGKISKDGKTIIILMVLAVLTLMPFYQIKNHDFIHLDDPQYVATNIHIRNGVTEEAISWAFTSGYAGNWHPITWISHMADIQLFGLSPGAHHLTNLFLHIANTLLLFLVLKEMTGSFIRSGLVAALFAVHPLHVESVAWIAERKDVLCAFFWMLSMGSYTLYARKPGFVLYMLTLFFFVLGLMSKPMMVTLPFVFLLLDYWPLARINKGWFVSLREDNSDGGRLQSLKVLLIEKIPFFVLAAISAVITYAVQQHSGAVQSSHVLSLSVRLANIAISYVAYLGKAIWPDFLAVYYPYPNVIILWKAALAALLLISLTIILLRKSSRHPFLGVGWLWYLGTLVPVIGIIQVGDQAMADRYTYLPLIGIFIVFAWGGAELAKKYTIPKRITVAICVVIITALTFQTFKQAGLWKNSVILFEHTISRTQNNYLAHCQLGMAYSSIDRGKARFHLKETIAIAPTLTEAYCWLALLYSIWGENDAAEALLNDALHIAPQDPFIHKYMGIILQQKGDNKSAVKHYLYCLSKSPNDPEILNNLSVALISRKRFKEAQEYLSRALDENPVYPDALGNMGLLLARTGNPDEAIVYFNRALRSNPQNAAYHNILGLLLLDRKMTSDAIYHFQKALDIEPGMHEARQNLQRALAMKTPHQL